MAGENRYTFLTCKRGQTVDAILHSWSGPGAPTPSQKALEVCLRIVDALLADVRGEIGIQEGHTLLSHHFVMHALELALAEAHVAEEEAPGESTVAYLRHALKFATSERPEPAGLKALSDLENVRTLAKLYVLETADGKGQPFVLRGVRKYFGDLDPNFVDSVFRRVEGTKGQRGRHSLAPMRALAMLRAAKTAAPGSKAFREKVGAELNRLKDAVKVHRRKKQ